MLALGFILLHVFCISVVLIAYHSTLKRLSFSKAIRTKKLSQIIIPIVLWTFYMYILSYFDVLNNFELPPRFPLLLIFPLFLFTGVFLYRNRKSEILHAVPKSWLIYFQAFRILVESLFIISVAEGILPFQVTFEGYNMDILFAATAPIIAYLAFHQNAISEKMVLRWNYLGLVVIASIILLFTTTIFFPSVWGSATTLADPRIAEFSNMLVPGFLMPLAVFVHLMSIIQLRQSIQEKESFQNLKTA